MALDIIGPGSNTANVTTARPEDDAEYGVNDTWFKDCTSPEAQDGTKIKSSFLNRVAAQLRRAIRGMGIAEDNADDDMLLKAIKKAGSTSTIINQFVAFLPMFPEIQTSDAKFALTVGSGQVVIDAGQTWLHRGAFQKSTDDYDLADRTFSTVANKTYHLRWKWNGPSIAPAFYLRDLADSGYNPGALAETKADFDTTYDDMLIAKIVTNGSNVLTVTPLENRMKLSKDLSGPSALFSVLGGTTFGAGALGPESGLNLPGAHASPNHAINWSRRPIVSWQDFQPSDGTSKHMVIHAARFIASRYNARPVLYTDDRGTGGVTGMGESRYYVNISA